MCRALIPFCGINVPFGIKVKRSSLERKMKAESSKGIDLSKHYEEDDIEEEIMATNFKDLLLSEL